LGAPFEAIASYGTAGLRLRCEVASDITMLLQQVEAGQPTALDRLVEVAYPELRRIARRHCGRKQQSATLQCTAIVHEAWIRLAQGQNTTWKNRAHFFAFASRLMRSILIDYARAKSSLKRGGGTPALTLIDTEAVASPPDIDILALNEALEDLERLDPMQGRIVELRYFSGLSIPDTAEATGVSESTVKREWIVAKTWIRRRLLEGKNVL
jgi:RNA polymerase sigma-70 factor, ECF subfamily